MTKEAIHLTDFPPFIRFELEENSRRKIFAQFIKRVSDVEVGISPDEFWRSVEKEFEQSRYELIFGSARGTILTTIAQNPLQTKELLGRNPEISPYTLYHALSWLKEHKHIQKKDEQWKLEQDYFNHLSVSDLAKIIDLRHKGLRRKTALSMKDLEMATYLWPKYEHASDLEGLHTRVSSYGRRYQNHFALARAVKEWEKGTINTPQWALIAIADLTDLDIEGREVIASYSLPPGVKIAPRYKGRYIIPIELTSDFDALALQVLLKSSNDGIVHPAKYKKALFKRLHYAFGSFHSNRIPLSIRAILEHYYQIPCCNRNSFRIPVKMKGRWDGLPDHEKKIAQILVLEMLFDLDQSRRTYEVISRSKELLDDISSIMNGLGIGTIKIHKRRDRPHYRSYLPRTVKENLNELKENVGTAKIEKGADFLVATEKKALIRKVKDYWGETGVDIISNLTLDKGIRDLELARASGIKPQIVRKILYELRERAIVTDMREETPELVEYYYYLCPEGIKKFLVEKSTVKPEREEEVTYPFPEDFTVYPRRKLFSEAP
jgi:DNA-binding HxlR family transcriptional regulator